MSHVQLPFQPNGPPVAPPDPLSGPPSAPTASAEASPAASTPPRAADHEPAPPESRSDRHGKAITGLTIAVVFLAALVAGFAWLASVVLATNADLRHEVGLLVTENEELSLELAEWQHEYDHGYWFDLEPEPLFVDGEVEDRVIEHPSTFSFAATESQVVEVRFEPASDGAVSYIELTDERGYLLAYVDSWFEPGAPAAVHGSPVELWYLFSGAGSHVLWVGSDGGSGGRLTAQLLDPVGEAMVVVDVTEAYPTDGRLPTYTFDGRAGQIAVVTMTSERGETLDPYVRLYGPDGSFVGADDDGGGGLDARLTVRLPTDGRYEVEADTYDGQSPRSSREHNYTVTVELVHLP
jgi:hypothetical protein